MKLKTRVFWRALPIGINILKLSGKASRNLKMPEYYRTDEKNYFLQKHLSKILDHLNVKLKVNGFDNVPNGPCLLIPNHSTYLDPLIMFSALWNHGDGKKQSKLVNFIAKKETQGKKRIKKIAELANTHFIDTKKPREALEVLNNFGKFVKKNKSCGVIFAEGTRTRDGKLGNFNSGAFRVAQSNYLPIIPVTINNAANALDWKRNKPLEVEVTFHHQIKPIQFQTIDSKALAESVKKIIASNYIDQTITSKETIKNIYSKRNKK
ncbi:1-acyl-sn-glycerol-3-phosphate acyltransferase [[Mycoplasma] phocae]|uniref:1-acyl-sn-glycerol-3-phosphate acyltransferase n=1 Tax=[Mycoplasma] phocae TaxID=142651 RepID=A0A2Z5IR18_9BACT|nr:lysophospholipid acyltransferase family protein [[Mycoplasma] phocae]AXE60811.1 1-acyl-sn-glycerol-3-phosphate acyltransferase [[Mycoplasma] phocae]